MNQYHRFWFTLSLALGQPVSVLQKQIDSREFSEWLVFNSIEPIGPFRDDIRFASISHIIVSAFSKNAPSLQDFVPDFWSKKAKVMSAEEIQRIMLGSIKERK